MPPYSPATRALGYRLRGLSWSGAVAGSLAGKEALVTGASSGLGEAACEGLALAGAHVHMLVRDRERGEAARERIASRLGSDEQLELSLCDLADLASVRAFAPPSTTASASWPCWSTTRASCRRSASAADDGFELTFATNVLGPFVLTELLLGAAAPRRRSARHQRLVRRHVHRPPRRRRPAARAARVRRAMFYAHTKRAEVVAHRGLGRAPLADGITFLPRCTPAGPTRPGSAVRCPASTG